MSGVSRVFLTFSALILIGMYLTGFQTAHWFLYIPSAAAAFAGITGICPGYRVFSAPGFKGQLPGKNIQTARPPAQAPCITGTRDLVIFIHRYCRPGTPCCVIIPPPGICTNGIVSPRTPCPPATR
jgi:hypothetical protein